MKRFYTLLIIAFASLSAFYSTAQTPMFAVNNSSDILNFIDTATMQPIGSGIAMTDGGVSITGCNGMAMHPCSGDIYIIYKMAAVPVGRLLGVVDPQTGIITQIGNTGDNVAGICFGDATHLYAVTGDGANVPETLFKVNMTTAALSLFVAYGNGNDGECIGFNYDDGNIYHWSGLSINVMEVTDTLTGVTTNIVQSGDAHSEIFGAVYNGNGEFIISDIDDIFFTVTTGGVWTSGLTGVTDYKGLGFPVIPGVFTPVISTSDPVPFCPGDSATYSATLGSVYEWYLDGVLIPGATSQTYAVTTAGILTATVTSVTGCEVGNSNPESISLFTSPNVSISPADTTVCPGESVLFTGASGGTLQWTLDGVAISGANSSTYLATSAGLYNQIKTNTSGCSDSSAVGSVVSIATLPNVSITPSNDTSYCTGDSIMLTGASGGSLQWYMNGVIIPGATSSTYFVSADGIYNMTKTNTSGCTDSSAVGVLVVENTLCDAGINEYAFNNSVKLYPSPANNELKVSLETTLSEDLTVVIYSMNGQKIRSDEFTAVNGVNAFTIPVSNIVSGMYIVEIQQGESRYQGRFIKQ